MPSRTAGVMATDIFKSTARVSSFRPGELNQPIVSWRKASSKGLTVVVAQIPRNDAECGLGQQVSCPDT